MQATLGDRCPLGLGTPALPRQHLRCRPGRFRNSRISVTAVSQMTLRNLAGALGSSAAHKLPAMFHLAAAGPLFHHTASLLSAARTEAALVTLASLVTVTLSLGGAIYCTARSAWESLEPWVTLVSSADAEPVSIYGVDVTGSRFFGRPAVQRAVEFAAAAHRGQVRKTQEPYVAHCVETARIVEGLLAPTEDDARAEAAVITALLHDVMDDAGVDPEAIQAAFGPHVASMVRKISQLSATNQLVRRRLRLAEAEPTPQEAAQLRHMILTMVSEPLVIVVKLADRLHNMRTVYALAPEKQRAVAEETRRVWCSLAERLGMFALKSELEDLCFAVLQPAEYRALRAELDAMWGVQSIPPAAVLPEDCCLSGECECLAEREGDGGDLPAAAAAPLDLKSGGQAAWLGAAHAALPAAHHPQDDACPAVGSSDGVGSDGSGGAAGPSGRVAGSPGLTAEQAEVQELVGSVLPFDASTFNMEKLNIAPSARRGLEVLQGCARALLQELTTEGVASGLEVSVQGRVKSLYSTFRKMARKGVPLSQVYDARALRVVVEDEEGGRERDAIAACYKLLPAVHRLWRRVDGEDDDYIAQPKESGYQSLHTAVVGPGGVPMEVQIRSSSMHEVAEYGRASHWAYKERPLAAPLSTAAAAQQQQLSPTDAPEAIAPGYPALHISPGGQLRDGVVLQADSGGLRLLVAVSLSNRRYASSQPTKASPEEYDALFRYVEAQGYFTAGQGDLQVALEMYTLCSDGKYHRLDQFGHKLPTTIVPLHPDSATQESADEDAAAAAGAPEHGSGSSRDNEMAFMQNRIRLLRSMIEWGKVDIGSELSTAPAAGGGAQAAAGGPVDLATEQSPQDVMVLLWPSGRIVRAPRGTTAGMLVQREAEVETAAAALAAKAQRPRGFGRPPAPNPAAKGGGASHAGGSGGGGKRQRRPVVNVNNALVPADTQLEDGDYVVLTKKALKV